MWANDFAETALETDPADEYIERIPITYIKITSYEYEEPSEVYIIFSPEISVRYTGDKEPRAVIVIMKKSHIWELKKPVSIKYDRNYSR